jgi:D-lyxose ketol-isomerase
MKRSEINKYINEAIDFFNQYQFYLPEWGYFKANKWKENGADYQEIIDNMLGWDVTDFGSGNFDKTGLLLFTIRNGNLKNTAYQKPYAEKIMLVKQNQVTPTHFHFHKMEDIINRAGGILCIQLWKADDNEALSDDAFSVQVDGVKTPMQPGNTVRLKPGQSICLEPYVYHTFWSENGTSMVGEVSQVNDDENDNRFLQPLGRFPEVTEDAPAEFLLCNEYPLD